MPTSEQNLSKVALARKLKSLSVMGYLVGNSSVGVLSQAYK